jgi:hypothetical protein
MSKKINSDLTVTINFADLLDNSEISDEKSEYYNMTAWKSVDNMLTNMFYQKKYNDERYNTAMQRYDTACDNAERIYGEDSVYEQADVATAHAYFTQYEGRMQHQYNIINRLGEIYVTITGTQPTSYTEWFEEQSKKPVRTAKTVKISASQKAEMKAARSARKAA